MCFVYFTLDSVYKVKARFIMTLLNDSSNFYTRQMPAGIYVTGFFNISCWINRTHAHTHTLTHTHTHTHNVTCLPLFITPIVLPIKKVKISIISEWEQSIDVAKKCWCKYISSTLVFEKINENLTKFFRDHCNNNGKGSHYMCAEKN